MTKQEFLAISLPYELKCNDSNLLESNSIYKYIGSYYQMDNEIEYKNVKPILHPLTDLTKEIEYNREVFIPIDKLYHLDMLRCDISLFEFINLDIVADHIYSNKFLEFTLILAKWHFDIAKLIDKGEAIDVNTLDENPYK